MEALRARILSRFGRLDILINNAANNPKMEASTEVNFSRLENFPLAQWEADIAVGLTGAFLCSKVFGSHMASQWRRSHRKCGVGSRADRSRSAHLPAARCERSRCSRSSRSPIRW